MTAAVGSPKGAAPVAPGDVEHAPHASETGREHGRRFREELQRARGRAEGREEHTGVHTGPDHDNGVRAADTDTDNDVAGPADGAEPGTPAAAGPDAPPAAADGLLVLQVVPQATEAVTTDPVGSELAGALLEGAQGTGGTTTVADGAAAGTAGAAAAVVAAGPDDALSPVRTPLELAGPTSGDDEAGGPTDTGDLAAVPAGPGSGTPLPGGDSHVGTPSGSPGLAVASAAVTADHVPAAAVAVPRSSAPVPAGLHKVVAHQLHAAAAELTMDPAGGSVEVRLNPLHLGVVTVRCEMQGDRATITLTAERQPTADAIAEAGKELERSLGQAGVVAQVRPGGPAFGWNGHGGSRGQGHGDGEHAAATITVGDDRPTAAQRPRRARATADGVDTYV